MLPEEASWMQSMDIWVSNRYELWKDPPTCLPQIQALPPSVQSEVAKCCTLPFVQSLDSMRYADGFTCECIASMAEPRRIEAGFDIVHQGEPADSIVLVLEGEVSVFEGGVPIAVVEPPAVLGEISLLWMLLDVQRPRFRTYRRVFTRRACLPSLLASMRANTPLPANAPQGVYCLQGMGHQDRGH